MAPEHNPQEHVSMAHEGPSSEHQHEEQAPKMPHSQEQPGHRPDNAGFPRT